MTINLFNNNKISNIKKNIAFCVLEPLVENHGGHRCRNFGKYSMFQGASGGFLVKYSSIFGAGCYNRKNIIFLFTEVLS